MDSGGSVHVCLSKVTDVETNFKTSLKQMFHSIVHSNIHRMSFFTLCKTTKRVGDTVNSGFIRNANYILYNRPFFATAILTCNSRGNTEVKMKSCYSGCGSEPVMHAGNDTPDWNEPLINVITHTCVQPAVTCSNSYL